MEAILYRIKQQQQNIFITHAIISLTKNVKTYTHLKIFVETLAKSFLFWIGGGANIQKRKCLFLVFLPYQETGFKERFLKSNNLLKYKRSKYLWTNKNEQIIAPVCCIIKQLKYVFPKAHCLYQRKNFFVIDSSFAKMSRCQKFWNYFIVLQ